MWSTWRKQPALYIAPGQVALVRPDTTAEAVTAPAGKEFDAARLLAERARCSSIDVLWGAGFMSFHMIDRVAGVLSGEERVKVARALIGRQTPSAAVPESLIDVVVPGSPSDWIAYQLPRQHADALSAALSSMKIRRSGALCAEVFSGYELASPAAHAVGLLEGAMLSWIAKSRRTILAAGQARVGAQIDHARAELRRQALALGISDEAVLLCTADTAAKHNAEALPDPWRPTAPAHAVRALITVRRP